MYSVDARTSNTFTHSNWCVPAGSENGRRSHPLVEIHPGAKFGHDADPHGNNIPSKKGNSDFTSWSIHTHWYIISVYIYTCKCVYIYVYMYAY